MAILAVNAGSSSLKLSLIDDHDETVAERELAAPRTQVDPGELKRALDGPFADAEAVVHRIVHGGERYRQAVVVDDEVRGRLEAFIDLAPLHQPKSLAALDAVSAQLPGRPAVACFDTAFHATLAPAVFTYALPARWRERWSLRRFGFHGLSHSWVARRAAELIADAPAGTRVVSCHLGAGASLCAIAGGESVDTTMGFTPLEGLVMATRSGSVDPGLLLWLLEREAVDAARDGGCAGARVRPGRPGRRAPTWRPCSTEPSPATAAATLAIDVYVHRLRAGIAAMAAAMDGLDVLVFTGGSASTRPPSAPGPRPAWAFSASPSTLPPTRPRAGDAEISGRDIRGQDAGAAGTGGSGDGPSDAPGAGRVRWRGITSSGHRQ